MKNHPRTTLFYIAIAAIPIVLVIFLIYWNIRQSLINNELINLGTIADLKVVAVNDYFDSLQGSLTLTAVSRSIKTNLPLLSRYINDPSSAGYIEAKNELDPPLQALLNVSNIIDVELTNASGTVVYASNPTHVDEIGHSIQDPTVFTDSKNGFSEGALFLDKENNGLPAFYKSAAIYDLNDNFLGVVAFEIDASGLYQLIQNTSGLGRTGETLIGRLESASGTAANYALILNSLRSNPDAAFTVKIPIGASVGKPIQAAVSGENGSGISTDYNGHRVLAAWRYMPSRSWGLVSKIDLQEILGPVNALSIFLVILSLIMGGLVAIATFILSRKPYDEFRIAVDAASEQIIISDPEGTVLYANHAVEDITGYTIQEALGKKAGSLWHLPMPKEYYQDLWKTIETDKKTFVGQLRNRRKNGEIYDAEIKISPVLNRKGNILYFLGIERDITNEKNLAATKSEALAKDDAILASVGDGLVVTDKEGKITLVNQAFESLTGWQKTEVIGKLFANIIPREDERGNKIPFDQRVLEQVVQGKVALIPTIPISNSSVIVLPSSYFVRKDGERFPVTGVASPIHIDGEIVGAVEVFRDITQEKAIARAKDEFISLASHQLRTPPSIIGWYTETLESGDLGPINKKQAEYLCEIYKANQRMVAVINSLLNISRIEMGTFAVSVKEVNVKDIFDDTIKEMSSRFNRKIDLKEDFAPDLGSFRADPNIMQIIIDNLLSNSFKYTAPENTKIEVAVKIGGGNFTLIVKDNGVGIPEKDKGRIFEKLFRADNAVVENPDGTGLGLYMIKKIIVDGLGGKIWFESKENEGAAFYVSLPASGMQEKTGTTTLARVSTFSP